MGSFFGWGGVAPGGSTTSSITVLRSVTPSGRVSSVVSWRTSTVAGSPAGVRIASTMWPKNAPMLRASGGS